MDLISPDSSATVSVPAKQALESDLSFDFEEEVTSAGTGITVGEPGAKGVVNTTGICVGEPGATGFTVGLDPGAKGVVNTTGI